MYFITTSTVHNINICFLAEEDEKTALLQHDDEDDDDDEASSMYTKNFRRPTVFASSLITHGH